MDQKHGCYHRNCSATTANASVCQNLSEMDWERGIWNAAFDGDINKVKSLIDKAKNPREAVNQPDSSGYTALHYAARRGHIDVCKILMQNGAEINAITKSGHATPLHKAAAAGKLDTVKLLMQSGASIETQDTDGQTVLHKAMENKHLHLVDILLKASPQLASIKDKRGRTPDDMLAK